MKTWWSSPAWLKSRSAACLAALALGVAVSWLPLEGQARRTAPSDTQAAEAVAPLSSLPAQAKAIHQRILDGGPFRYEKDGSVFGNRERLLPIQPRGYYREYTVPTPGARDRGARRIVCGGNEMRLPETCFFTWDHYSTFYRIDPTR